jgi:hypothetical protein
MSGDRLRELFDQYAELPGDGQPVQCLEWPQFEAAARALLAETQPTQAEILKCCWLDDEPELCPSRCVFDDPSERISDCTYARCLHEEGKDKAACKYYRAAVETQPEPVEPTQQELEDLAYTFGREYDEWRLLDDEDAAAYARAVLARWGRPAPVPQEQADA